MLESGTGASSLQARLSSVLDSISHFADTYADWTSCAPGYAQGPAFRLHAHTQAAQEHGSLETGGTAAGNYAGQASQAPALPILGEVWDEHVAFARVHAEGVAGLRALRQTVKREADFLEKVSRGQSVDSDLLGNGCQQEAMESRGMLFQSQPVPR